MFVVADPSPDVCDENLSDPTPADRRRRIEPNRAASIPLSQHEVPEEHAGRQEPPLRRRLVCLDAFVTAIAWMGGWLLTRDLAPPVHVAQAVAQMVAGVVITVAVLRVLHLYRARVCVVRPVARRRLVLAASVAPILSWAGTSAFGESGAPGRWLVTTAFVIVGLIVGREAFEQWLATSRVRGRYFRPVIVAGSLGEVERLVALLSDHPETGCEVVGWVGARERADDNPAMAAVPWLGTIDRAATAVDLAGVESVVVSPSAAANGDFHHLVDSLQSTGTHIQFWTGLWSVDTRRLRAAPMAHEPFFYLEPAGAASGKRWIKRAIDVVLATTVLVLALPVLAIAALAIKLSDGGPIFFRQVRVGYRGTTFRLHKFRTMAVDAERRLAELELLNERSGPLFKVSHDPRVTKVGRILRATSIDELPQLLDVLSGHLSLVGPRPALPAEVAEFDEDLLRRHDVLPGVTGLWQVEARHNPSFEAYRRLDLFYVQNWTLTLDLVLLLATVKSVLTDTVRELSSAAQGRMRRRQAPLPVATPAFATEVS